VAEIERKFLVRELPAEAKERTADDVWQGYLSTQPVEVRIRGRDGRHELTLKATGGLERAEVNLALTAEQFDELRPLVAGTIEKTRTAVDLGSTTAEIDVYGGKLAGLRVVEVEFPSEAAARAFVPPPWFGREVTADPRYRNAALAEADAPPEITLQA
jgi:CYTH domain-containing protein